MNHIMRLSIDHTAISNQKELPGLSILIVDDDDLTRMHIQLALTKSGFKVTEAKSGSEALTKARKHNFDTVLMDVKMPIMDGFETCLKFRKQPNNLQTPIIMITGLDDDQSIQHATDVGATDYVTKPVNISILAKRLKHIIAAHKNTIELDDKRAYQIHQQHYIESISLTDTLTGLPNKQHFIQTAKQYLNASAEETITILQLNFDSLTSIKNNSGTKIADKIVIQIADRLNSVIKQENNAKNRAGQTEHVLARTGDAEFHILYTYDINHPLSRTLIEDINNIFKTSINFDNYEFRMSFKSGGASSIGNKMEVDTLIKMAGIATHKASVAQITDNVIYTPELEKEIQRQITLEAGLYKAITNEELKTVYQPKVDSITRKIKGVEALLRWQHPDLGFISPAEFIPIAEECGLILTIGEYVMKEACKQACKWKQAGLLNPTIAINVSGHQFNQRQVTDRLFSLLDLYELLPSDIELEITESIILEQKNVIDILNEVRTRGIKIAIDDFGTGYSSLSMLKTFPVDILKIDRAFVKDISESNEARNIADAILALGHALDLTIVAEGIETDNQLVYFRDRNCHLIQGYLTGKPMSAEDIQTYYL